MSDLLTREQDFNQRVADELNRLEQGRRLNHLMIVTLATVVGLLVLVSTGLGIVGRQARQAQDLASENAQTDHITCVDTNRSRQSTVLLWDYILSQPNTSITPQQAAQLRQYIHENFKPVKCG